MSREADLERIRNGLRAAAEALRPYTPGAISWERKEGRGDPVTVADRAANTVLREVLPQPGEGWLSEESVDDRARLGCARVWVVDPIDGTREFIEGIPEWCVSVGLLEGDVPVAGGIYNPSTDEMVLGALDHGVTYNGAPASVAKAHHGGSVSVLASRSEVRRGEWNDVGGAGLVVRACGSVAYKLGLVAAGRADATWTLVPKSEWDVAAGCALVRAGGGVVTLPAGQPLCFNKPEPIFPGLIAAGTDLAERIREEVLGTT